ISASSRQARASAPGGLPHGVEARGVEPRAVAPAREDGARPLERQACPQDRLGGQRPCRAMMLAEPIDARAEAVEVGLAWKRSLGGKRDARGGPVTQPVPG